MSAEQNVGFDISLVAGADLSSYQFYAVYSTGDDGCQLATSATGGNARVRGVLQNEPSSYQAATVRVLGLTKWYAGEAVAAGNLVTSSTGGAALVVDTTGQYVCGWANTASTAAGQVIEVFLIPGGVLMGSTA